MLDLVGINYLAVFAVWLVYVVVGAWWYSPMGFGKQWSKNTGVDIMKMPTDQANKTIMFVALSAIVQALALAVVFNSLGVTSVMNAVWVGGLVWLGFTAATTVGNTLYARQGWKHWWLNSSYFLVVMLVGSVILALWQ